MVTTSAAAEHTPEELTPRHVRRWWSVPRRPRRRCRRAPINAARFQCAW